MDLATIKKLWIFNFSNTIIRTYINFSGYFGEITIDYIETLDDLPFLNLFFGNDDEDYRLFLTMISKINSCDFCGIVSMENTTNDIIIAIVNKYFRILKFPNLIDKFNKENVIVPICMEISGKHKISKTDMIVKLANYYNMDISKNIMVVDCDIESINGANELGVATYHIDNNYRNPYGLYYNDCVKMGLLPFRRSLNDKENDNAKMEIIKFCSGPYMYNKFDELDDEDDIFTSDLHSQHPFGTFALVSKSSNAMVYKNFDTFALEEWININPINPLTRELLPQWIINRIKFYNEIQKQTKDMNYENLNNHFDNFMHNLQNGIQLNNSIEPHVFITVDCMINLYTKTFGFSLASRNQSEEILKNENENVWLVRNSSQVGDMNNHTFVVSMKTKKIIRHTPYVMRKGCGIAKLDVFSRCAVISNLELVFEHKTVYELLALYDWAKCIYFNAGNNKNNMDIC